jgi:hypothetical protein
VSESNIALTLSARAITQAAFAEVNSQLDALGLKAKETGDGTSAVGRGLFDFSESTKASFATMGTAVGIAGGAVLALGAGIVALGMRGADVADMRASFEGLNKTIGNDSTAVLAALKTSFAGTVSDFALMEMSNKALSMGLKAGVSDFGLLGDSARVLSDRGLGTAEEAFETLAKAMATGKMKQAELLIGNIDAGAAYAAYGKEIGKAASELSESEKVTATSIAITKRLKDDVMAGGKAQFDFADAVKASGAMVDNFKNSLSDAIAKSPVVNAMLASFKVGLEGAFGVDQKAMVSTLTGYVNLFALKLVDMAKFGLDTAGVLNVAFSGMKLVFLGVAGAITITLEGIVKGLGLIVGAAEKIPGIGDKFKGMGDALRDTGLQLGGMRQSFMDQTKEAWAGVTANSEFEKKLDKMRGGLATTREAMVKAMLATKDNITATDNAGTSLKGYGEIVAKQSKDQIQKAKETAEAKVKLFNEIDKLGKDSMPVGEMISKGFFGPITKKFPETIGLTKDMEKEMAAMAKNTMPLGEMISKGLFGPITKELPKLAPAMKGTFASAVEGIGPVIMSAMQGGGNVIGAVGSHMGSKLGTKLVEDFGSKITGALGSTLGGALNAVIPGVGAMLGPLMSAIGGKLKGLFGIGVNDEVRKYNLEIDKVREALLKTHGPMDALEAKAKAVGLSFKNEWGHQGKAGLDMFNTFIGEFNVKVGDVNTSFGEMFKTAAETGIQIPSHLRPTIEHLIKIGLLTKENALAFGALGREGEVDFKKMQEAAQKYGINLADLGPKFQSSKLHDAAKTIIDDFNLLKGGGADVGGVLSGMSEKISALVQDSMKFGVDIPENMRPMIQSIMDAGRLIGEDGQALTDMSKINFGAPIVDGFSRIVEKIEELIGKITGPLSNATQNVPPIHVPVVYDDPGFSPRGADGDGSWRGDGDNEGYATGGVVDAGAGRRVTVHGREAIIPLDRPSAIGRQIIREIVAVSDSRANDRLDRALEQMSAAIQKQASDSALMPDRLIRGFRDSLLQLGAR